MWEGGGREPAPLPDSTRANTWESLLRVRYFLELPESPWLTAVKEREEILRLIKKRKGPQSAALILNHITGSRKDFEQTFTRTKKDGGRRSLQPSRHESNRRLSKVWLDDVGDGKMQRRAAMLDRLPSSAPP